MRRRDDEAGIGIIVVIGITATLLLIMTVSVVVATNSLSSARKHVYYETAMAAAESGLWSKLGEVQTAAGTGPSYAYSSSCTPNTPVDAAAERAWAQAQIARMLDTIPGCVVGKAGEGEYFAFVTTDAAGNDVVYAQGWSPSRAAGDTEARSRVVKMTYQLGGYKPTLAVLGDGNVNLSASSVSIVRGGDNSPAGVHANGNVTGAASLTVQGRLAATGTNNLVASCPGTVTGGCVQAVAREPFPAITAATLYRSLAAQFPSRWYTLCVDSSGGYVYRPPAGSTPPANPCPTRGTTGTQTSVDGWSYASSGTLWTYNGSGSPGSLYYIHAANAAINFTGGAKTLSVIVGANGTVGGDLTWTSGEVAGPISGLVMFADGNLTTGDGVIGRTGVVGARGSVTIGANAAITGSVIAGGSTTGGATAGNVTLGSGARVTFDGTRSLPVRSVVRTVQWQELIG